MENLQPVERAKRIFFLVYGREPVKDDKLTLNDSLVFAGLARELSDWAIAQGFEKKVE